MKLDRVVILQNKVDLLKQENAEQHYQSITKFIKGTVADHSPIIPISAQLKFNIDAVCEQLVTRIPVPLRDFTQAPQLIVSGFIEHVSDFQMAEKYTGHPQLRRQQTRRRNRRTRRRRRRREHPHRRAQTRRRDRNPAGHRVKG